MPQGKGTYGSKVGRPPKKSPSGVKFTMQGFPQHQGVAGSPLHTKRAGGKPWHIMSDLEASQRTKSPKSGEIDEDNPAVRRSGHSPLNHLGSGTTGPNQKHHHNIWGPEGPKDGVAYPAVAPRAAGSPKHKPGESPTVPDSDKEKEKKKKKKKKEKKKTDPLEDGTYTPY